MLCYHFNEEKTLQRNVKFSNYEELFFPTVNKANIGHVRNFWWSLRTK